MMSENVDIKHLRTMVYGLVSDACVSGTPDLFQEAQALSDKLYTLILASGPEALTFLLESLERDLNRGDFSGGDEEDGYNPAVATDETKDLLKRLKAA